MLNPNIIEIDSVNSPVLEVVTPIGGEIMTFYKKNTDITSYNVLKVTAKTISG